MGQKYFGFGLDEGRRESQHQAVECYKSLLEQVTAELEAMGMLLAQVRKKKSRAQRVLCKCLSLQWANGLCRPRTIANVKVPGALAEVVTQALSDPLNPLTARSHGTFDGIAAAAKPSAKTGHAAEPACRSVYEEELENLLGRLNPTGKQTAEERRKTIDELLSKSLTGYSQSTSKMILYVHFKYNFPVANPLLLLSGRWQLVARQEGIVRYVDRKRKHWRESSGSRYVDYKAKYLAWKDKTRKLEIEQKCALSEQRQQRRVDIYGREAHGVSSSPLIPIMSGYLPESDFLDLGMSQLHKDSIDYDIDLCTYCIIPFI